VLQLLTDEQISPTVAVQAPAHCLGINIRSIRTWENGHFQGAEDEVVLSEAVRQKLTLVTFDLRTVPPLLRLWAEQGLDHAGVILVDERTIPQNDIGGLIGALCAIWRSERSVDWTNRIVYLRR
jgi:hypothetical protein